MPARAYEKDKKDARDVDHATYVPEKYRQQHIDAIRSDIELEGWDPALIHDPPGRQYPSHEHATAKLLVFVEGSMQVEAGGEHFACQPGDLLVIPGSTMHSAVAGPRGCTYFWSEQVREIER